jgi:hypothetical protein
MSAWQTSPFYLLLTSGFSARTLLSIQMSLHLGLDVVWVCFSSPFACVGSLSFSRFRFASWPIDSLPLSLNAALKTYRDHFDQGNGNSSGGNVSLPFGIET